MGRKPCAAWLSTLAVLTRALSLLSVPVWAQDVESATRNYEDDLSDVLKVAAEKLLPLVMDIVTRPEVSTSCSTSMLKTFVALRQQKAWAIRMAMSNAMYAPNALEGTYVAMGGYDQCLRTRVRSPDGELYFKGQYCSVVFALPSGYYRRFIESFDEIGELQGRLNPLTASSPHRKGVHTLGGLCAPSMCTRQDLTFVVRSLINEYGGNATVTSCSTDDTKVVNSVQVFSIAVLCLLGVLVGVGTTLEWLHQADLHAFRIKRGANVRRVLLVFSAITNTKILLRTTVKPQNEALKFICGLKVIMTFWVVLGHAYIILPMGYFHAVFAMDSMTENFTFQFITNAFLSVTVFFFLSGFLLAYVTAASREALARTNPFLIYIVRTSQRYIRLVVPAMVTILVAFLLPLFAYGPGSNDAYRQYIHGCYSKWWIVLLQANNFDNSEDVCLKHMWYISAELQIFLVVAFPLALLFIKHPTAATITGALTATVFCLMTCVQVYSWDLFYAFTSGSNDMRSLRPSPHPPQPRGDPLPGTTTSDLTSGSGMGDPSASEGERPGSFDETTTRSTETKSSDIETGSSQSSPPKPPPPSASRDDCGNSLTVAEATPESNEQEEALLAVSHTPVNVRALVTSLALEAGTRDPAGDNAPIKSKGCQGIKEDNLLWLINAFVLLLFTYMVAMHHMMDPDVVEQATIALAMEDSQKDSIRVKDTLELIYFRPFTHAGPYIAGVMCGYVASQYKNVTIKPKVEMGLWLVSLALACGVLFVSFPWNQGHLPDAVTNALYGGFHRLLWALAFFWPSYACATGRGGILNNMLSWRFFLPLSRLTCEIYLIHVLLYITRMLRLRSYINTDEFFQLTTALGVFLLSVVFAYLLQVCVEAPTVRLEKLLREGDTGDTIAATPVNGKPFSSNVDIIHKSTV
nr:uncharacterized protein LOC119162279 [Rhipicephalus microplus]